MEPFWQPPVLIPLHRQPEEDRELDVSSAGATGGAPGHYLGRTIGRRQLWVVGSIVAVVLFILGFRAFSLQIVSGETYRRLAEGNRVRFRPLIAPRGLIEDRYGQPLSRNVPRLSLAIVPADAPPTESGRQALFAAVSAGTGLSADALRAVWPDISSPYRSSADPYIVSTNIAPENGPRLRLLASSWPGIELLTSAVRAYPAVADSKSLSHVLGYTGRVTDRELSLTSGNTYGPWDSVGKSGVEAAYESVLRGRDGRQQFEIDALGRERRLVAERPPVTGETIRLTIDADLARAAESALRDGLRRAGVRRGAAVVLDSRDGSVLALVSLPAFDANEFSRGQSAAAYAMVANDPDRPLFNRAIQGVYPPGSTIKLIISAAALAERVITEGTRYLSTGGLRVGQSFFPDWKAGGHGWTDVRRALAESINTFFYIVGGGFDRYRGLGIERIVEYAERFGLGQSTGVDLPGEAKGLVPSPAWKERVKGERWYIGDTYHVSIGQGDLLVTPLQVANYTAAVANGGTLYQPHLYLESLSSSEAGQRIMDRFKDKVIRERLVDPAVLAVVRAGMRQAVTGGSARSLFALPVAVAGKTGTAEPGSGRTAHAWFTGFAPYDKPEIVVTVLLEEAGEGSTFAVPVARDIFSWWTLHRSD